MRQFPVSRTSYDLLLCQQQPCVFTQNCKAHLSLSSASSMASGWVPQMRTLPLPLAAVSKQAGRTAWVAQAAVD